MVGRLSHGAEEQVAFNQIAAREPVTARHARHALSRWATRHAAWSLSSYLRLMWARGPPWKTLSLTVVFDDSA